MIDYYEHLQLDPATALHDDIEHALRLARVDGRSADAVRHILLHPSRRAVYDKHLAMHRQISDVRARFVTPPPSARTAQPNDLSLGTRRVIGGIVVVAAIAVFVSVLTYSLQDGYAPSRTPASQQAGPTSPWRHQAPASRGTTQSARQPPPAPTYQPAAPQQPSSPPLPLPQSGVLFQSYSEDDAVAPFEIVTQAGREHFYIKLVDVRTRQDAARFFVRGGERLEVTVPLGRYQLRYASGTAWYGEDKRFGPTTSYHQAQDPFSFRKFFDRYSGFTVELFSQVDGNLRTDQISETAFDR